MQLKDFIEPILIGVPSLYIPKLKELYRKTYGTNVCGTCGNLYLIQLVEYYAKSGLEIILDQGEVEVKPIKDETITEGLVISDLPDAIGERSSSKKSKNR